MCGEFRHRYFGPSSGLFMNRVKHQARMGGNVITTFIIIRFVIRSKQVRLEWVENRITTASLSIK